MFYRCQRFTSNQYKDKRKGSKDRSKGNRSAPWSGAPDCPVCHWTVSGAPPDSVRCTRDDRLQTLHLRVFQAHLRYNSPDCPVCHRTVRCASGATATCTQRSTLQSEQCKSDVRADGQRGTRLSGVAPDCPVPHEDKASNGRPAPSPNGRMTWRHTGHYPVAHRTLSGGAPDYPVRPSPAAFSNGYNLVGGYKYHPNRPLQSEGAQATFQVI
jgi:hypothetical protein